MSVSQLWYGVRCHRLQGKARTRLPARMSSRRCHASCKSLKRVAAPSRINMKNSVAAWRHCRMPKSLLIHSCCNCKLNIMQLWPKWRYICPASMPRLTHVFSVCLGHVLLYLYFIAILPLKSVAIIRGSRCVSREKSPLVVCSAGNVFKLSVETGTRNLIRSGTKAAWKVIREDHLLSKTKLSGILLPRLTLPVVAVDLLVQKHKVSC